MRDENRRTRDGGRRRCGRKRREEERRDVGVEYI